MRVLIDRFSGMVPLLEDSKLPVENAKQATNCRFDNGSLAAYGQLNNVSAMLRSNTNSLFLYEQNYWFSWPSDVDAVNSPINNDAYARVYYTGDGAPKMTANTVALASAPYPSLAYRMGVKKPAAPFIVVSNNQEDELGTDNNETRFYVVTFVNGFGEEGQPSDLSTEVTINNPQAIITLTLPDIGTNDQNITHYRVYRTNIAGDAYQLVAQLPIATAEFIDDVDESLLGIVLDTDTFSEPNANMQGLTAMPNGILAGFYDSTVCFSEAFLPHAWPVSYELTTESDVVALAVVGVSLIAVTTGKPYIFDGVSPDAMAARKLEINQACVAKRSMVDMGEYAIYASPDGLVAISANNAEVITKNLFNKKKWQAYQPDTIIAANYEGKYVAFYNGGGFIFDPTNQHFIEVDFSADALYNDLYTDTLYLSQSNSLKAFDESASALPFTWTKTLRLDNRPAPTCVYIDTTSPGQLAFNCSVDGVSLVNYPDLSVSDINQTHGIAPIFRLPDARGRTFEFTVTGTGQINRIAFGSNMGDVING